MVEQHPHILKISTGAIVTEPYQDDQGDWVIPAPGEVEVKQVNCRAQENKKEERVVGVDGTKLDFSYMVFLPHDCPEIQESSTVQVFDGDKKLIEKPVKRFHRGQINARIWV